MLNLGGHMPCNYVCGHYMTLPWCQPQANAETSEIVDKRWLFGCCNEHWASWPRAILAAGSTKPSHKKKWKSCLELGHLKPRKKKYRIYRFWFANEPVLRFMCVSKTEPRCRLRGKCWSKKPQSGWWFGTRLLFSHSVRNFIIPMDFHTL